MRISATGMRSSVGAGFKPALLSRAKAGFKPAPTNGHRAIHQHHGFTLIELLVVIVIIGIILAVATISIGVLGRDSEVEDQTRRLYAVLTQAREEAELQGRDLGLLIEQDGYLFMRYNYSSSQWQLFDNDELLAYRDLPEGLRFRLWLDSREVILKSHSDNQKSLNAASSSESSSASSSAATNAQRGPTSAVTGIDKSVRPQIAILSSGDIVPFELQVARDNNPYFWRLLGGADNSLNLEPGSEAR